MHRVSECGNGLARRAGAGRARSAASSGERPGGAGRTPSIRTSLVERVRREIASGTYDTPGRLDAAAEKLLDRLVPRFG